MVYPNSLTIRARSSVGGCFVIAKLTNVNDMN